MFDVRRGREGLSELAKDTYKRTSYNKVEFYEKTRGGLSKNHSRDSVSSTPKVIFCSCTEIG